MILFRENSYQNQRAIVIAPTLRLITAWQQQLALTLLHHRGGNLTRTLLNFLFYFPATKGPFKVTLWDVNRI